MKKVVLTITELDVGGAEKCLTHIALGLDRARFQPTVIVVDQRPTACTAFVDRLEDAEVPVHFLGATRSSQLMTAVRGMTQLLRQLQPDVVQSFLFHANMVTAVAAWRAGVKRLLAGIRVAEPKGIRQFLERRVRKRFEKYVCVNEQVARQLTDHSPDIADRVCVIPNGVDTDAFPRAAKESLGLDSSCKWMTFVGRLTEQKGLDQLLPQLQPVFERLPNLKFLIVGDGEQRQALEQQCKTLSIAEHVQFTGWRADAAAIIGSSDLLVLPSRWEGMPNVVLEAMAAEIPVLTSLQSGTKLLLDHAAEQIVDVGSFGPSIESLLNDPKRREQLGQANRQRVERDFSLQSMVAQYEKLFEGDE